MFCDVSNKYGLVWRFMGANYCSTVIKLKLPYGYKVKVRDRVNISVTVRTRVRISVLHVSNTHC